MGKKKRTKGGSTIALNEDGFEGGGDPLRAIFEECLWRFGGVRSVLDLGVGTVPPEFAFGASVFRSPFPPARGRLPYLSDTVEVVVVPARMESLLPEARRIASHAVAVETPKGGVNTWAVEWKRGAATMPSATVVLVAEDGMATALRSLLDLRSAVPGGVQPEVVVVAVGADDEMSSMLDHATARFPWVKPLRLPDGTSFIRACNRGARRATGDVVTFMRPSLLLGSGWLGTTLRMFASDPRIGVVASKLVGDDQRVLEAGGILFEDGRAGRFGFGLDSADALVSFARPVDWCSIPAMTTTRSLFDSLGGFDADAACDDVAAVAYCLAARDADLGAVYQPLSERTCIVSADCVGPKVDAFGMSKRGDRAVWRPTDASGVHPRRPPGWDRDAMVRLLFRDRYVAGRPER